MTIASLLRPPATHHDRESNQPLSEGKTWYLLYTTTFSFLHTVSYLYFIYISCVSTCVQNHNLICGNELRDEFAGNPLMPLRDFENSPQNIRVVIITADQR